MRRLDVNKNNFPSNAPKELKPWKSLRMFKSFEELQKEAKRLIDEKREVRIVEKTLTLNYR